MIIKKVKKNSKKIVKKIIYSILCLPLQQPLNTMEIMRTYNIIFGKYFYKKKYQTSNIIDILKGFGIGKGSNVFIHSSWANFYNFTDSPKLLIDAIIDLIGPDGTLAMPAYPIHNGKIFNVKTTPTGAGLIAEAFRRYPGVVRSASVQHSVCALGPLADYIVKDHHLSRNRFDELSSYYRIIEKDFTIICMGLTKYFPGTSNHCFTYIYRKELDRFKDFYNENVIVELPYKDINGIIKYNRVTKQVKKFKRSSWIRFGWMIEKYFDKKEFKHKRLSNLMITSCNAKYENDIFLELARKGKYVF